MNDISPVAWVFLGIIVVSIILLNVGLFSLLKNKGKQKTSMQVLSNLSNAIRNPNKQSEQAYSELNQLVQGLQKSTLPSGDPPNNDMDHQ